MGISRRAYSRSRSAKYQGTEQSGKAEGRQASVSSGNCEWKGAVESVSYGAQQGPLRI